MATIIYTKGGLSHYAAVTPDGTVTDTQGRTMTIPRNAQVVEVETGRPSCHRSGGGVVRASR